MKTDTQQKFGFAIIGTGAIATIHAQAIGAIDNARLIAVYNRTFSKAKDFAKQYNCNAYDSLDNLLLVKEIDIVCICTPSGAHAEPALRCIEAGKHCLIEKPIEISLQKADQVIHAARLKRVALAVVYPSRFYESSKSLKKAISDGRFGRLVLASAYVKWNRSFEYYNSADWRGTRELDGGGALMNQAIHAVDMLQWCMGPVESVIALKGNFKHTQIEVEDTLVALLRFANGALGTIECSTAVYPGAFKKLEIMGISGTVIIEDNSITTWKFDSQRVEDENLIPVPLGMISKGGVSDPLSISYYGHQKQIENFINAILQDEKPLVDGDEGRKSVEIVLAIYRSAETGEMINLPYYENQI